MALLMERSAKVITLHITLGMNRIISHAYRATPKSMRRLKTRLEQFHIGKRKRKMPCINWFGITVLRKRRLKSPRPMASL